jgi:mannose-1-phosphate guanylyltransferase
MKAFLLAAGLGTRLRPFTDTVPKCMLPVAGKPLLGIWLDAFAGAGVDEVLVNLHYLPDVVTGYLAERTRPPVVRTTFEPELLGSAGTLLTNRAWVEAEPFFLACYADNLTDFDLCQLVDAHLAYGGPATLALFRAENPRAVGIVELDGEARVVAFTEKPEHPTGDLANAGMYAFSPSVLGEIAGPPPIDIGYGLLPKLVGKAQGLVLDCYLRDIGTTESYKQAQDDWARRPTR